MTSLRRTHEFEVVVLVHAHCSPALIPNIQEAQWPMGPALEEVRIP